MSEMNLVLATVFFHAPGRTFTESDLEYMTDSNFVPGCGDDRRLRRVCELDPPVVVKEPPPPKRDDDNIFEAEPEPWKVVRPFAEIEISQVSSWLGKNANLLEYAEEGQGRQELWYSFGLIDQIAELAEAERAKRERPGRPITYVSMFVAVQGNAYEDDYDFEVTGVVDGFRIDGEVQELLPHVCQPRYPRRWDHGRPKYVSPPKRPVEGRPVSFTRLMQQATAKIQQILPDKRYIEAGFIMGQMEKVRSGSCPAAMFCIPVEDSELRAIVPALAAVYGLDLEPSTSESTSDPDIWVWRKDDGRISTMVRMAMGLKVAGPDNGNAAVVHSLRAMLCGIPANEVDPDWDPVR